MMLWVILTLMTAAAILAVVWPLARKRRPVTGPSDLAVYRDQLEEIERDRSEGRIGRDEFEAARVEVSRRLLAAAATGTNVEASEASAVGTGRSRPVAALAAALVIPLLAAPVYAVLGWPGLPGAPVDGRASQEGSSIASLIAQVENHLEQNPEDGRGWEIIAPVYMKLERYDEAVKARRNALRFLGATPEREVNLGEALIAAANGVVTADAKQAFEGAVATDGNQFKALFYLGLAADQDGKPQDAAHIWKDLIAKAPVDAPWLAIVRDSLARVEPSSAADVAAAPDAPAAAPGPRPEDVAAAANMTADQRNGMIQTMVDRLATRLHEDGSDVDGWLRLLRAYMVMGDRDKARTAAGEARVALAQAPDKLRVLEEGVKGLGVGD